MGLLDFGSGIFLVGIGVTLLVFVCKMFFVLIEKEFKLFRLFVKIALSITAAGAFLLFLGKIL